MVYICAPSYPALIFSLKQFNLKDVTVISRNVSIKAFCEKVNIACHYMELESDVSRKGLKDYKRQVVLFAKNFNDCEIIFCHQISAVFDMYLLQLLKPNNKIYYQHVPLSLKKVGLLKQLLVGKIRNVLFNRIVYRLLLGINFSIYGDGVNYLLGYSRAKIYKNFNKWEGKDNQDVFEENGKIIMDAYEIDKCDYIYIDTGLSGYTNIDTNLIGNNIAELLQHVIDSGNTIGIKAHPMNDPPEQLKSMNHIERSIPAELLTVVAQKGIIGIYSMALNHAGEYIQTLSIINLIELHSLEWREDITSNFISDKVVVLNSREQFNELINPKD